MANRVFANSRGVAHKGSAGKTIAAFPDVCYTPGVPASPVPIPYPHIQKAIDAEKGVKKVKVKAEGILKSTQYKKSTGDEPGTRGGMIGSKTTGKSYFVTHSMDVKTEGKNVNRSMDLMTHNKPISPGPAANANPAAAAMTILDQIESALAAYQNELKKAPRFSFPQAQQIQKQYEAKFKQLLTQLKAAAANLPQLRAEMTKTERLVAAALAGK